MRKGKLFITGGVIVLALAVSIGVSGSALAASANANGQTSANSNLGTALANGFENAFAHAFGKVIVRGMPADHLPSTLSIGPSGHTRITRGNVTAASSSSITISVWGLSFNVNPENTLIEGSDEQVISLSGIRVGDTVSVSGMLNPSTETISADQIFDYSFVTPPSPQPSGLQAKYNELLQLLGQLQAQLSQMEVEITSTVTSTASAPAPTPESNSSSSSTSTSTSTPSGSSTSTGTSTQSTSSSTPTSTQAYATSTTSTTQ